MPAMKYVSGITNKSPLGVGASENNIRGNHMDLLNQNGAPSLSLLETSRTLTYYTSNGTMPNNFQQNLTSVDGSAIPNVDGLYYPWNFYFYDMSGPFGAASGLNTTSNHVTPVGIETVGDSTAILEETTVINPLKSITVNQNSSDVENQKKKRHCHHSGCGRLILETGFNNHWKTHDTEREKFKCVAAGCGKSYFHKRSLRKHQRDKQH
jgi:hypothetical protein